MIAGTLSANTSAALNVALTLDSSGVLNEAKLESNYRLAQQTYAQALALFASQVSQMYWSLVASQASIAAYQRAVDQALLQYDVVLAQYQAGLIPELDLVRSQLAIEDAKTNLQVQKDAFVDSLAEFKAAIGLSDSEQSPTLENISYTPLELPTSQELIALYREQRFDIQLARLNAETTTLNADIVKRQAYSPTVTLSGGWEVGLSSSLVLSDSASFAVSMKIPLDGYFTSSDTSLSLLEAQEAAEISSLTVQEELSEAALEIESYSTNLRRIQDRVQVAEDTLTLTQRAASLSHAAYDAGLIAYTELNESREAVLTAEETLIQLKLSHNTTLHNLAYALGMDAQTLTVLYQQLKTL